MPSQSQEIARRRTFAIISHPDAGKTTLTEKLLLYGGAIHLAGSVKRTRGASARHQRLDGDRARARHLDLDQRAAVRLRAGAASTCSTRPGHNDFSEDTYRTLAAADCGGHADRRGKGVEPQTIKLFEVCRMRGIPIVTFINKMDRDGRTPLELLDEIEQRARHPVRARSTGRSARGRSSGASTTASSARCCASSAPTAARARRRCRTVRPRRSRAARDAGRARARASCATRSSCSTRPATAFDSDALPAPGELTPVFFGSAMTNFGVEPFLDRFVELAPPPAPAPERRRAPIAPDAPRLLRLRLQDPGEHGSAAPRPHRLRARLLGAVRARHGGASTCAPDARFAHDPHRCSSWRRSARRSTRRYAGDIIGLWDARRPAHRRHAVRRGATFEFEGDPALLARALRARARSTDPLKRKQLKKGLEQLSEEGAVQLFFDRHDGSSATRSSAPSACCSSRSSQHRLQVGVRRRRSGSSGCPTSTRAGSRASTSTRRAFERKAYGRAKCVVDVEGRPLVLFDDDWAMRRTIEEHPELEFVAAVQPGRTARAQ